jgi:hypothetical protein
MTTSLILRPQTIPTVHILEVDGPRHKHYRRGEFHYYLATNNHQRVEGSFYWYDQPAEPHLKGFDEPYWEIIQHHDGGIEVHACRPSDQEARDGELYGALGSTIKITWPCRPILRNALRLARRLCKADPIRGLLVSERDLVGIVVIETNIPVYLKKAA